MASALPAPPSCGRSCAAGDLGEPGSNRVGGEYWQQPRARRELCSVSSQLWRLPMMRTVNRADREKAAIHRVRETPGGGKEAHRPRRLPLV